MNSQSLKQKQQQKLTPAQLMMVRLLQMPAITLEQAIKEEMERNPLLEEDNNHADDDNERNDLPDDNNTSEDEDDGLGDIVYDEEEGDYNYREHLEKDPNQEDRQIITANSTTFLEYLQDQLNLKELTEQQRAIAEELIGNLDDAGYLSRSMAMIANDLAFRHNIDVSDAEVLKVLKVIQTLDPPGIGARSLKECLSLQLHHRDESSLTRKVAIAIVDDYFEDFTSRRYDKICNRLGIDEETLQEAIDYIQTLNPKPGNSYSETSDNNVQYISPDFVVTRNGNELSFYLTRGNMPSLRVSQYYVHMLRKMTQQKNPSREENETIKFLREKNNSASMFITALQQRQETLTKTMEALLRFQYNYFLTGDVKHLRPMRLKDIADITGQDISTVSRVVTQKYVQTEFDTFLLKELFSTAITNQDNEDISSEAIRRYISEAIEEEDKHNPLSDEKLMALLKEKGYLLARRTIAKYRMQMNIPVARLRKKI